MIDNKKIKDIEGQRGLFQIISVLNKNGELLYSKLYNNKPLIEISNNSTAKRALDKLIKYSLIYEKVADGGNARYYRLTEKGKRFAILINKMEKILKEK